MVATMILIGLLVGLILFDLAVVRWGVDSTDTLDDLGREWQRRR